MGDSATGIFIKSVQPFDGSAARSGKIQTGLEEKQTRFI